MGRAVVVAAVDAGSTRNRRYGAMAAIRRTAKLDRKAGPTFRSGPGPCKRTRWFLWLYRGRDLAERLDLPVKAAGAALGGCIDWWGHFAWGAPAGGGARRSRGDRG